MQITHINNNSDKLIVFLTGWGCDDNQFRFMKSKDYDILICYDYSTLDFEFDFSKYNEHYLISFSAGVCITSLIKDRLPKFKKSIAINGNPLAYNEYYGLRKEIIDVFEGVTQSNAMDFRREFLVYDDNELKLFNKNQSLRSFESCMEELIALKKYDNEHIELFKFDVAMLSQNDRIFYIDRQKEFWSKQAECIILDHCAHFPFLKLDDFDKIIQGNYVQICT